MRLAILGTRGIPAGYGGFETFAEQLATRLVERGHGVTVYAEAQAAGPLPVDADYRGVRIRFQRRPRWGAASVLAYDWACLWDARKDHDLVYMLGYGAAFGCWLPRLYGTPVWINVDGLEWARSKWSPPARAYLRLMEWVASRTATRLIADARAIRERFTRKYPRGAPCSYIAYGAELESPGEGGVSVTVAWGLEPGAYLLVVARPEPENHLLEIIQGYLSSDEASPLVVVGRVDGATAYQRRLLALACSRVRFIGAVYEPQRLAALRRQAACYLHGHSVGGTNPSLLEAMACGNWIIAHDNPFNREVAGGAAEYFSSPQELARRIASRPAWGSPAHQAHSEEVRQIVARNYNWLQIVDAYEALMRRQCDREHSGDA